MNYSDVYKRVDKYLLNTEDFAPRFINVHNSNDFNRFIQRYNVGTNKFISVSKYAMKDGTPSVADMLNDLTNKSDNIFITGVSTILKLLGVDTLKKELLVLASTSYQSHVVFICFQSEEYLKFSDTRLNRLVYDVDGEKSPFPHLVFYTDPVLCPPNCKHVIGIQNICDAEKDNTPVLYVKTNKERSSFPYSLLSIRSEKNSYEALCNIDPETRAIPESHGTEAEWNYALKEINEAGSWTKWISKKFGSIEKVRIFAARLRKNGCLKSLGTLSKQSSLTILETDNEVK